MRTTPTIIEHRTHENKSDQIGQIQQWSTTQNTQKHIETNPNKLNTHEQLGQIRTKTTNRTHENNQKHKREAHSEQQSKLQHIKTIQNKREQHRHTQNRKDK